MNNATLIEQLCDRVHRAWMAEKQRQGFADHVFVVCSLSDSPRACDDPNRCHISGRGGCDVPQSKHHADMLPYADRPEHVKEYDRATVRAVLDALADLDYGIVGGPDVAS